MTRFVVGDDRSQSTLFPERLDDYVGDDNPVRAIDVFGDELDLGELGFGGVEPRATGRPAYHPATLLKIYIYGYLNRDQSKPRDRTRLDRWRAFRRAARWQSGRLGVVSKRRVRAQPWAGTCRAWQWNSRLCRIARGEWVNPYEKAIT